MENSKQEEPHITIPLSSIYILHFFSSAVKSHAPPFARGLAYINDLA